VQAGEVVTVHLTGWVEQQGTPEQAFLSTRREGRPLKFLVGTDKVLPGWNEGVQGMRVGGRRLLKIPPELGLGVRGFEDAVPPNAHLVFIMEVLAVRPASVR
ncbi:MAG TPA: FKBP-type peptidyl-prolyl cis-trans isomerase, partial [Gammaproteobacteria bacterium]|nr:FKBP-type peptidyl-prolyl cis-trans isomerase [Gammaproteobacteria bacterium]